MHRFDFIGRLLGLSQRQFLLPALGVLASEESDDGCVELVSSVEEGELHQEEVAHDFTANLLDEVSGAHGRTT